MLDFAADFFSFFGDSTDDLAFFTGLARDLIFGLVARLSGNRLAPFDGFDTFDDFDGFDGFCKSGSVRSPSLARPLLLTGSSWSAISISSGLLWTAAVNDGADIGEFGGNSHCAWGLRRTDGGPMTDCWDPLDGRCGNRS